MESFITITYGLIIPGKPHSAEMRTFYRSGIQQNWGYRSLKDQQLIVLPSQLIEVVL